VTIHFLPVPYLDHEDEEDFVLDVVYGTVVLLRSHVHAVEPLFRLQLFYTMGTMVFFEGLNI
jgi:hypothetical protein